MRGVVEMRFKVGDRVRILENLTLEDVGLIHDMLEFEGLEATVETVFDQSYHLTVDNHDWYWMDELLEPVEGEMEMETKKYVKFEIPETMRWLARDEDGSLYGYTNKPIKCSRTWGIGTVLKDEKNLVFITEDPNHYLQVKWSDEEPTTFKDGITITDIEADDLTDEKGGKIAIEDALRWGFKTVNQIREGEPDMVNTPPHYKQYSFEPIDIITEVVKEYPPEIGFHVGTVLKYLFRSPFKGKQLQDLEKAEYYLQRAIKELDE